MQAVRIILASVLLLVTAPEPEAPDTVAVRFMTVDVFVDSGNVPLAAYQFDFAGRGPKVVIVGLEGGQPPAFADPPYYDPQAMQGNRVIAAAFSTRPVEQLPAGRVRVTTLHLQVNGEVDPDFDVKVVTAAGPEGKKIQAKIHIVTGDTP